MTAALTSSAVGSIGWALAYSSTPSRQLPWISYADLGWLAYYPLAYAAIVLMVRARVREFTRSTWLDGLVSGPGGNRGRRDRRARRARRVPPCTRARSCWP